MQKSLSYFQNHPEEHKREQYGRIVFRAYEQVMKIIENTESPGDSKVHDTVLDKLVRLSRILGTSSETWEWEEYSPETLLNRLIEHGVDVIPLETSIYPRWSDEILVRTWAVEWFEESRTEPKYQTILQVLVENGIYLNQIKVFEEKLEWEKRMRKVPYRIIHIPQINKTITVSDKIGEAIFIYDWKVRMQWFSRNTK